MPVKPFAQSWLFTPGWQPEHFNEGVKSGAQALLLDLEDSVAPDKKAMARDSVVAFLAKPRPKNVVVAVRVNAMGGQFGPEDMAALKTAPPDYVLLPKIERPEQLDLGHHLLIGAPKPVGLLALIESSRGVGHIEALVEDSAHLDGMMFGSADYTADLGQSLGALRTEHARSRIVNAAAMRHLPAIDSPFFDLDDEQGLLADCASARFIGFTAKAAVHPNQLDSIHRAFARAPEEIARARRILAAKMDGVTVLDGRMIDAALVRWAKRILPDEAAALEVR